MSEQETGTNKWVIALAVMLPALMEVIDTSVANVALPSMQGSLNAGTDEVTWVLTSYMVSNAVVLPITGWLSRMFGRKRFLMTCTVLFTLASLLCGAAPNLATLIFFRVVQGAAGGALIPISQAILLESFPKNQQAMGNAIFGVGVMFGPIIGPALGGWITDNLSWRWIFYINVPVGIVALLMVGTFVFDPPYLKRARAQVDYLGLLFLTVGIGALQIVLDKGQQDDWFSSPFIVGCSVLSVVTLLLMVYVELKHPHPIVNLRLFKDVGFSAGNLVMFIAGFGLYGSLMLIPLLLQSMMGYTATQAGMVLAPGGMATLLLMPAAAVASSKLDGRKIVAAGLIVSAWSMFIYRGFPLDVAYADFIGPRVLAGVGMALLFVPLTTLTLGGIKPEQMGDATGLFSLLRNIGGSVGIAATATMLSRFSQVQQTQMVGQINPYNPVYQQKAQSLAQGFAARGLDPVSADRMGLAMLYRIVQQQAAILSCNRIFWVLGIAFLVVLPFLLLLKRGTPGAGGIAAH
ncbi:DHA2 family efflux MFS transporter permease subunit [Geomesophilobacter sediminis]|uniref:DHA2 family efflux MFS transporter permease subunit n=1 Tax=Geomesophilobacter sediminis TaxID=2798584 RepID=A0A8J7JG23_9BACT|nr:DHA2 family efflux MFS transporter permease subunit [Geomesophilobacter sediminis]MBJ6725469.1 DHA2 family efflux MFS transporter permease subunit [Geomesophilobacter sediminis]